MPIGRHQIDDARGETIGHRFQPDALHRADDGQFVEGRQRAWRSAGSSPLISVRRKSCAPRLPRRVSPFHPLAIAQVVAAAEFRRDEDIVGVLGKAALRIAQKAKAFAGNFDDAFRLADFLRRRFARQCFRHIERLTIPRFARLAAIAGLTLIPVFPPPAMVTIVTVLARRHRLALGTLVLHRRLDGNRCGGDGFTNFPRELIRGVDRQWCFFAFSFELARNGAWHVNRVTPLASSRVAIGSARTSNVSLNSRQWCRRRRGFDAVSRRAPFFRVRG